MGIIVPICIMYINNFILLQHILNMGKLNVFVWSSAEVPYSLICEYYFSCILSFGRDLFGYCTKYQYIAKHRPCSRKLCDMLKSFAKYIKLWAYNQDLRSMCNIENYMFRYTHLCVYNIKFMSIETIEYSYPVSFFLSINKMLKFHVSMVYV